MSVPDDILLFSGFALAHAAYSICDAPEARFLIPLFMAEHQGKRGVRRFEADTQEEAITTAKRHIEAVDGTLDLWTFSREGSMVTADGSRTDVLSLDASSAVFSRRLGVVQQFRSAFHPEGFALLGVPIVTLDGEELSDERQTECFRILDQGFAMHPAAETVRRIGA
ncbi:hypothetical protein [Verrucomicrobium sp. BvORR034]|uniref:hypothetical protein n=1 Tax=Verrucomicrobium sp. BvORR034 TaxID=1396418 RepID=UPI000678F7F8|nr:hypothetical protein [Verrucomicrobium sp. BvORR034]